jgi:transcription elongation GreA/GreB family factor
LSIVGHDESDPAAGYLGFTAPLARALIGGEVSDGVEVPGGAGTVSIIAVAVTDA